MSVPKYERAPVREQSEIRGKALLQVAIAEAFALVNAGAPREAVARLAEQAEAASLNELACYAFGLIYFNAEDLREALIWFDRALARKPDYLEALDARAIVLQRLGQLDDALDTLEDVVRLRPDDADARFTIAVILQSLGRMSEALRAYEDALRVKPDHCEALTNRGALLERFGRFDEALACFELTASLRPKDGGAMFNKGSVLQKLGRNGDALAAYEAAARIGPADPETELNRGNVLQKLERLEEAIACYDRAALRAGGYPQALYNKGIALHALGRAAAALSAYDAALALDPAYCEAACNRGNVLHELGRLDEAFAAYAQALKIRPSFLPALANRANIFLQQGEPQQALRCCDEALRHDPGHPQALGLRGAALHRLGRLDEALASLDLAVARRPGAPEAWLNRGNALQEMDRLDEAVSSYHEALRIRPNYAEALSGLGVALKEQGDVGEALRCFEKALAHKPNYPDARNNRAGALLLSGRRKEGFADFESRWERSNAPPLPLASTAPQWTGQELAGKTILVHDEQGLGDLIQFCRYLPLLERRGAKVVFACRRSMHRLLSSLGCSTRLVSAPDPKERHDFSCALLSLPFGFATELATIPASAPYLFAEPRAAADWGQRIGENGFRIGVCWRGNASINLKRGFPIASLGAVAAIAGVRLISLVKGEAPEPAATPHGPVRLESLGEAFDAGSDAFIDCAAAMQSLDLVITSDTAIAHLAGALGRPVFLALRHAADWRWLLDRRDSPWYPSMRLFRQPRRDCWEPAFDEIAAAVASRVASAGGRLAGAAQESAVLAIPGAIGELIDKITILEIKQRRIDDPAKLRNIRYELALLRALRAERALVGAELARLESELKTANETLWEAEDALRACERARQFDDAFIALARQVYASNDQRAALKKEINLLFNSAVVEEKSYSTA